MTSLNPTLLRSQTSKFALGLRGYQLSDVETYLARLALVAEVIAASPGTTMPREFSPDRVRNKTFDLVWRGCDADEVDDFLDQVAADIEHRMADEPMSSGTLATRLHLPATIGTDLAAARRSGVFEGAVVEVEGRITPVTFFAADKLATAIIDGVAEFGVQAFENAIIVDDLSDRMMQLAFDRLRMSGELARLFGPYR